MEQQTLRINLLNLLKSKASDNSTYRKALTIYESILDSTKDIPNFQLNYCNSDPNFALFVFGSVFKLLIKDQQNMRYSIDAMLLIINQTLPLINISALKSGNNILHQLQLKVFHIITGNSQEKTPLMLRFAISILSYTLVNTDSIQQDRQAKGILEKMFDCAVESHRTNILSKQASKMLVHLIKDSPNLAKILSTHANMTMLHSGNSMNGDSLSDRLYLNNVREVIAEFPFKQINDIGHRLVKHLATVQCSNESDELYLAQTYFFIEKLVSKFSGHTLEEMCKQLINNIPTSAESQSRVIFCYVQCLHSVFEALVSMNEKTANKYVSVVISILQEFIVKGGKIQKQSFSILKAIMSNCIRKSLWVTQQSNEEDFFDFESIGLDGKANNFKKVVCMMEAMLTDQFRNHKAVATILQAFFGSLDDSALEGTIQLIDKIVRFRDKLEQRPFRNVMHSIFAAMTVENICKIYPISISGDIASAQFENQNNLWMLHCTQKFEGEENFITYGQYYFPILIELRNILSNPNLTGARRDGYKTIKQMLWRCLKVFCKKVIPTYDFEPLIESIKLELQEASDSTMDHIAMALQHLCSNLYRHEYECKWANNLISLLAKQLVLQKNNSKQILRAIKYLSVICEKEYLNRVFDKNITKLIQEKEKNTLCSQETVGSNLKNLQILIAVSNGINFYDPSIVNPFRVSREQLVVKLIEGLIADTTFFQKKAYKYILETLPLMGRSYLIEVVSLLEAHHHKILVASKHYRLAILMYLWTKVSQSDDDINQTFEFIKKYLPEVLVDLRESNQRARKQAHMLFEAFCSKLEGMDLIQNFIEIMCAGLATDSVEMKIATINGITAIYNKKLNVDIEFSLGILEIILMLLYEKKQQIYKTIVDFCRRFIFAVDSSKNSSHILSTIIEQLFKADIESKMQHRSILKHLLLKLSKKFGRAVIQKMIPSEDRKILSNAIKTQKRERRQKRQKQQQRRIQIQEAKKKQEQDQEQSDDEAEQYDAEGEGMDEENDDHQNLKQLDNTDNLLLKYDLEKQNFHFEQEKLQIKANLKKTKQQQKGEDYVSVGEGGMIIVKEDPKRSRDIKNEQPGEQQETQARAFLNVKKKRKSNDIHEIKQSGATFSSKKAGGDVKVKDKPEPYAFIQFNSKALNKRFKKKAENAFNQIFQRKQGGLKGIKSKIAVRSH